MSYDAKNKLGLNFYHLDPRWCSYEDFDFFVDRGFVNSVILAMASFGTTLHACRKMKEIGGAVWLCAPVYFSRKETITEYMEKIARYVNKLKENDVWDTVVGFHWDEPLLHYPHTNEDLLEMTKALTEEYGKRIYPVFSGYEVMGKKGNHDDPEGILILESFATKYITDAGFDSYGYDFRVPSTQAMQNRIAELAKTPEFEGITSSVGYYERYFDALKNRLINPDTKIWVYPCAYDVYTWAGIYSDEDYCIEHLKGLTDILLKQEHPGGISCYTYKSWGPDHRSMDYYLGKNCPERWEKFEAALIETYNKIKDIEVK